VNTRLIVTTLVLYLWSLPGWGLSNDRNQPLVIEADKASLDEDTGIAVYSGNVLLQQGTMQFKGNQMTVYIEDDGVERVVLEGRPASYVQRMEDDQNEQQAEAGRIEYQTDAQLIILEQDARVWREGSEEFSSNRIVVNLRKNTVKAGGDSPGSRVRIILQPRVWQDDEQTPAPRAACRPLTLANSFSHAAS